MPSTPVQERAAASARGRAPRMSPEARRAAIVAAALAAAGGGAGLSAAVGVSIARNEIGYADTERAVDYYTNRIGPTRILAGNVVMITEGARKGQKFEYVGPETINGSGATSRVDLSRMDYANTTLWREVGRSRAAASVTARINDASVLSDFGDVVVRATSEQKILSMVQAIAAALSGGGLGVGVAGSGASANNRLATDVQALVQASYVDAGNEVSILATDNSTIDAVTGASALAASYAAIGVGMAIGVADATNIVENRVRAESVNSDLVASGSGGRTTTPSRSRLTPAQLRMPRPSRPRCRQDNFRTCRAPKCPMATRWPRMSLTTMICAPSFTTT